MPSMTDMRTWMASMTDMQMRVASADVEGRPLMHLAARLQVTGMHITSYRGVSDRQSASTDDAHMPPSPTRPSAAAIAAAGA